MCSLYRSPPIFSEFDYFLALSNPESTFQTYKKLLKKRNSIRLILSIDSGLASLSYFIAKCNEERLPLKFDEVSLKAIEVNDLA